MARKMNGIWSKMSEDMDNPMLMHNFEALFLMFQNTLKYTRFILQKIMFDFEFPVNSIFHLILVLIILGEGSQHFEIKMEVKRIF
jgi:hypothetical protein